MLGCYVIKNHNLPFFCLVPCLRNTQGVSDSQLNSLRCCNYCMTLTAISLLPLLVSECRHCPVSVAFLFFLPPAIVVCLNQHILTSTSNGIVKIPNEGLLEMLRCDNAQSEWAGILVQEQGFGGCLLVLGVNVLVARL